MDMDYVKMWLKSLIKEEINKDQLKSVADATGKSEEYLRHWVIKTDPTPNQSFGVWLLRGIKKEWIRFEDGPRAKQALERFIQLRRVNQIGDIMQFPHIGDLEDAMDNLAGVGAKRQGFSGIDPTTLPGVSVLETRPDQGITYYKISNASSLAKIGEGTKWCTRYSYQNNPNTAQRYIRDYGYLIVGYKDGKPFVQYNPDFSQIMDVNDRSFHNARDLKLTRPDLLNKPLSYKAPKVKLIRPVQPKRHPRNRLTSQQKTVQNWMTYSGEKNPEWEKFVVPHGPKTLSTTGKDLGYEKRVANSILKTKNHEFFSQMMEGLADYGKQLGAGNRAEIIEKALLNKNFADIQQNYGFTYKGSLQPDGSKRRIREKRAGINGLYSIAQYVKFNIGGHWPEFEQKLQNDPYNSVNYYNWTGLNPDYVTDPLTKDTILFSKMMKEGKPTVSKKDFNETIKDFFTRTRARWKHGNFSSVIHNVIKPYLEMTNQSLQDVVGNELAQTVAKSFSVGRGTEYWNKKPNKVQYDDFGNKIK